MTGNSHIHITLDPHEIPGTPEKILRDGWLLAMKYDAPWPIVETLKQAMEGQSK